MIRHSRTALPEIHSLGVSPAVLPVHKVEDKHHASQRHQQREKYCCQDRILGNRRQTVHNVILIKQVLHILHIRHIDCSGRILIFQHEGHRTRRHGAVLINIYVFHIVLFHLRDKVSICHLLPVYLHPARHPERNNHDHYKHQYRGSVDTPVFPVIIQNYTPSCSRPSTTPM